MTTNQKKITIIIAENGFLCESDALHVGKTFEDLVTHLAVKIYPEASTEDILNEFFEKFKKRQRKERRKVTPPPAPGKCRKHLPDLPYFLK